MSEDLLRLADKAEDASRVLWRWASEDNGPWERAKLLRVSGRMGELSEGLRSHASIGKGE